MPYLKNTQAFSNYIEGEINFDVLDDNSLGDIATSNRQGFAEDDERVALLISLVKPIVSTLIVQRVKVGQEIREEEDKIKKEHEAALKAAEAARQELEIKNRVTEKNWKSLLIIFKNIKPKAILFLARLRKTKKHSRQKLTW